MKLNQPKKLNQTQACCSDFDVSLDNLSSPDFRVLLPEHVDADELEHVGFHTIPGEWTQTERGTDGIYCHNGFEVSITIEMRETVLHLGMDVKNISDKLRTNVRAEFCTSINHLPAENPWCNRSFMPREVDEDRDQQGRHWFEQVTPERLQALTEQGWLRTHPSQNESFTSPQAPGSFHDFERSKTDEAYACAVQSLDGRSLLFQAWDRLCIYCTPSTQNACMHICPPLADRLEPGQSVQLRGVTGLFYGNWDELSLWLEHKRHAS